MGPPSSPPLPPPLPPPHAATRCNWRQLSAGSGMEKCLILQRAATDATLVQLTGRTGHLLKYQQLSRFFGLSSHLHPHRFSHQLTVTASKRTFCPVRWTFEDVRRHHVNGAARQQFLPTQ